MALSANIVKDLLAKLRSLENLDPTQLEAFEKAIERNMGPHLGQRLSTRPALQFLFGQITAIRARTDLDDKLKNQLLVIFSNAAQIIEDAAGDGSLDADTWLLGQDG